MVERYLLYSYVYYIIPMFVAVVGIRIAIHNVWVLIIYVFIALLSPESFDYHAVYGSNVLCPHVTSIPHPIEC